MKFLLSIALLALSFSCLAQNETERYVFWQPNVKLTFDMFCGTPTSSVVEKLKGANTYYDVALGLWGVLDVPKTKRMWKKMPEKSYFCAAMDKTKSFLIVRDSAELKYAQLFWDICELATRVTRKTLLETVCQMDSIGFHTTVSSKGVKVFAHDTLNQVKSFGLVAMFYTTALNDGKEFRKAMTGAIFNEVVSPRNEDAYRFYRNKVDSLLLETEKYATKAEEIERFIRNTPEKGYITPTKIVGDFKNRGEIRY